MFYFTTASIDERVGQKTKKGDAVAITRPFKNKIYQFKSRFISIQWIK